MCTFNALELEDLNILQGNSKKIWKCWGVGDIILSYWSAQGIVTSLPAFWNKPKLFSFCLIFDICIKIFRKLAKNMEKGYFDQCLKSRAPKRWSKYTTCKKAPFWGFLRTKFLKWIFEKSFKSIVRILIYYYTGSSIASNL